MKRNIGYVELIIVLVLVVIAVKVWTYKKPEKVPEATVSPAVDTNSPQSIMPAATIHNKPTELPPLFTNKNKEPWQMQLLLPSLLAQNNILMEKTVQYSIKPCPECNGILNRSDIDGKYRCPDCDLSFSFEEVREKKYVFYYCPQYKCRGGSLKAGKEGFYCRKCDYFLSFEEIQKQDYKAWTFGFNCPECRHFISENNNILYCTKCSFSLSMEEARDQCEEIFWPQ